MEKQRRYMNWRKKERKQNGYRLVSMPDHPNANKYGYVLKHRLLAEEILGRYLKHREKVCFINNKTKKVIKENIIIFKSPNAATFYIKRKHWRIDPEDILYNGMKKWDEQNSQENVKINISKKIQL